MVMDIHNLASWPQHPKLLLLPSPHPTTQDHPENKVHGANMGPIWGREDPCGPHELCYLGNNCHRRKELVQMACWATSAWRCAFADDWIMEWNQTQDHLMTRGLLAYTASLLIQIVANNLKFWESTMSLQDMTIVFNKKWIKMDRKQKNVWNTGYINLQWWIQNSES